MFRKILLVSIVLMASSAQSFGDIVMLDDFSGSDGNLVGRTPDVGGVWTQTGTIATNPIQVTSNRAVLGTGQDAYSAFSTAVPTTTSGTLRTSFSLTVASASTTGDYFLHLSDPVATTGNFYNRIYARSSSAGNFQLGLASTSGTGTVITYGTTDLAIGTTYQVSSDWNFVSGLANDTFSLSVDGGSYISGYTWTGNAEPTATVSAVNLRQGGGATFAGVSIGNLQISSVPEPTSMVLVGLIGGVGLIARVRRRQVQN